MRVLTVSRVLFNNLLSLYSLVRGNNLISENYKSYISSNGSGKVNTSYVISLTSYPLRYNILYYTLLSLLCQKTKFLYSIDLWIAECDFEKLPSKVLKLNEKYSGFFNIKKCQDFGSQKKIESFSELESRRYIEAIITADDDLFYPASWLDLLITHYKYSPESVYCCRARSVGFTHNREIKKYKDWIVLQSSENIKNYPNLFFFTGVGGVIYPRDLCIKMYRSIKDMRLNYINADDILLNYLTLYYNYDVKVANNSFTFEEWWPAITNALGKNNVTTDRNDKVISLQYSTLAKSKMVDL